MAFSNPAAMVLSKRALFTAKTASRLLASSQVWSNVTVTNDCDVVVIFHKCTSPVTLNWVTSKIKNSQQNLLCNLRYHEHTKVYILYVSTDHISLMKAAEDLSIRKDVKTEFGGGKKEFVCKEQDYFAGTENMNTFFSSQERQSLVQHMLFNVRAVDGDHLGKIKFLEGQAILPFLMSKKIVVNILPLHNKDHLSQLQKLWVETIFRPQPIEKIKEYFGVKIAMYFAYLEHYTKSLIFPTVFGILLWYLSGKDQQRDDMYFVMYALFNVIWATLYLESWKRASAEYAYDWGVDVEDELIVEPRPLYHGQIVKSKVTGRNERQYPIWKRNLFRYVISWPLILFCLGVVFTVMLKIFAFQDWINKQVLHEGMPSICKFFPKILLAVVIGIMDEIYKKIAYWLNDKENYRLDETYENNLIIKLVLFQFVNSFLSLFYIAFYLQDLDRLKEHLATLLITRQILGNIKEAVVPFFLAKAKLFHVGYNMTKEAKPLVLDKQETPANSEATGETSTNVNSVLKERQPELNNADSLEEKPEITSLYEKENTSNEEKLSSFEKGEDEKDLCISKEQDSEISDIDSAGSKATELNNSMPKKEDMSDISSQQTIPHLTQAEIEANMKSYEDTFEDHLEMFIQFGYVTLFSSAFPLAALCAFLNNVIEIRSDAFKLCVAMQRPFGKRVAGIGTWQDALEIISIIAIMVNCAMIGMSDFADRLFPNLTTSERIVAIVILEHVILALKFILAYAIPDVPHWVAQEKARLEYMRRDALKKLQARNTNFSPQKNVVATQKIVPNKNIVFESKVFTHVEDYRPEVNAKNVKSFAYVKQKLS